MIKNLFKAAWENEDPEIRINGIEKLSPNKSEDINILIQLAVNDKDNNVRAVATAKLDGLDALIQLVNEALAKTEHADTLTACVERLNQCLRNNDTTIQSIQQAFSSVNDTIKPMIAANAFDEAFRQSTIDKIDSEDDLLNVLNYTHFSATRYQIAERLNQQTTLEKAKQIISGKDKRAERVIKDKLDVFKREQYAEKEESAQREQILLDIEPLAQRAKTFCDCPSDNIDRSLWRQDHLSQSATLNHRWETLHSANATTKASAEELSKFEQANQLISLANTQLTAMETAENTYPDLIETANTLQSTIDTRSDLDFSEIKKDHANLAELTTKWHSQQAILAASSEQQTQFDNTVTSIQALLTSAESIKAKIEENDLKELLEGNTASDEPSELSRQIDSIHELATLAPAKSQLRALIKSKAKELNQVANEQKDEFQTGVDQLYKQVNNVLGSVRVKDLPASFGKLKRFHNSIASFLTPFIEADALKAITAIADKEIDLSQEPSDNSSVEYTNEQIQSLFEASIKYADLLKPQKETITALKTRVEEVQQHVKELDDWKSFATEPQCLALCEKMETLAENKEAKSPPAQAKKLSALLSEWKKLGACTACDTHWQRFKTAMDIANEPCATYFVEQKALREENHEMLKSICTQMHGLSSELADQESIDPIAILKRINHLDAEWKKFQNVERSKGQLVWQQYKGFRDKVYDALNAPMADNLSRKETLVKRAEKVFNDIEDKGVSDTSLDTLKQLQASWKTIGPAKRHQDSKVWKQFKAQCDAIYGKIKDTRDSARAEDDKQIDERYKLIKAISALAKSSKATGELDRDFSALQEQYKALAPLSEDIPEKKVKSVEKSYRFACNDIDKAKRNLKSQQRDNELEHFVQKAKLANNIRTEKDEAKKAALKDEWNEIELSTPQLKADAKKFLDEALKGKAVDTKAIEEEKRLLCIQAELASNTDTPKSDQPMRMQYQLQLMQKKGLGKTKQNNSKMEFLTTWYTLAALDDKVEKTLFDRLSVSLEKMK